MKEQLPTVNYLDWLDAFQKRVAEAQQSIENARQLEPIYRNVVTAMRDLRLPHDVKIELETDHVDVTIIGQYNDDVLLYEEIRDAITCAIDLSGRLRNGSKGSLSLGSYWWVSWRLEDWKKGAEAQGVKLWIQMPREGTRDLYFERIEREVKRVDVSYDLRERSEKKLIGWKEIENKVLDPY